MVKLTSIESNRQWLDGGSMFGNAPRALWKKWTEIDSNDRIPLACRCLLIETPKYKILCETGIGAFFSPQLAERFGVQNPEENQLVKNLATHGLTPDDIDYVILSHLHFDHAGGLLPAFSETTSGVGEILFSNAQIIIGEKAWQRALNPHPRDRASFIPELNEQLKTSNKLVVVSPKNVPKELSHFMEFYESDGHTPGQLLTVLKSTDKALVFAGDLVPGKAWVHIPITMGYDRFPEKVIEEKKQLYLDYQDKNLHLFFTHDPNYALGLVEKNDKGKYQAVDLKENMVQMEWL